MTDAPEATPNQAVLIDLAIAKAFFQARTIATVIGVDPNAVKLTPMLIGNGDDAQEGF